MQSILLNTIKSLNLDPKDASKLKDRIKDATTPASLVREINNVMRRGRASIIRRARVTIRADIKKTIKKKKPKKKGQILKSKTEENVGRMLQNMSAVQGKSNKQTQDNISARRRQMEKDKEDGFIQDAFDTLEERHLTLVSQGAKADVFELAEFSDDLKGTIAEGEAYVSRLNQLRDEKINADIAKANKVLDKRKPGVIGFFTDRDFVRLLTDPVNHLVETYNTWVDGVGLHDVKSLTDMNVADIQEREALGALNEELHEWVNDNLSGSFKHLREYHSKKDFKLVREYTHVGTGEIIQINMTKGEVMQRVMEMKNPAIRKGVVDPKGAMGYPADLITEMEQMVGEKDQLFIDKLFEMYEASYDRINEVYKRMYNIDLPKVEFYTAVSREVESSGEEVSLFENILDRSLSPSLLKARVDNKRKLKDRNVIDVATKYFKDSEYWIAYAEKVRDAFAVINDPDVKQGIIDNHGESAYGRGVAHLNNFARQQTGVARMDLKIFDIARKNFMLSALGLKPQIGFKQLSSTFGFAEDVPVTDFVAGMVRYLANPKKANKIMEGHSSIRYRGKHFDNELNRVIDNKRLGFFGEEDTLRNFFMMPVKYGDAAAIKIGGYSKYLHLTEKKGVSPEDALNQVAALAERSQQSTLKSNLSLLQKNDNSILRLATMFTSSPIAMINMQMQAVGQFRSGKITLKQMTRKIAIYQVMIPAVFSWIASGFDGDGEEVLKSSLIGPWSALPLAGNGLEYIATTLANTATDGDLPRFRATGINSPVDAWLVELTSAAENLDGSAISFIEFATVFSDILTQTPISGGMNIFGGVADLADGDFEVGMKRIAGFSERTAEESSN